MIKKLSILFCICAVILSCASTPKETPKPEWVDNPNEVFDDNIYISRVGEGFDKTEALTEAQLEISRYFGQNIKSTITGQDKWSSDGKGVSNEKHLNKEYEINFDTTLFALNRTKPWYDVSTETWYICAYLDRNKTFEIFKPKLLEARNLFFDFYRESINEQDLFKKLSLLRTTKQAGNKYMESLKFAQIILPSVVDLYENDFNDIANVDILLNKLKNDAAVKIVINKDYGTKINNCVSKYFSNEGFKISDKEYNYIADINIDESKNIDEYSEIITADASINISLKNKEDGTIIFTYTKSFPREKSFSEINIDKKIYSSIEKELNSTFEIELQNFLNK